MPNHIADVFAALLTRERTYVADLDPEDPGRLSGIQIEVLTADVVDFLRNPAMFDCPKVNDLMQLVRHIFEHKVVPIGIGPPVDTPTLVVVPAGVVICMPPDWHDKMEQDPQMQIGAVVYTGSNVRDYFRGNILSPLDDETIKDRASSYEAEYLHAIKRLGITEFDEYQQQLMTQFPDGVPDLLAYDSGEFFSSTPC